MTTTVALLVNPTRRQAVTLAGDVTHWLAQQPHPVHVVRLTDPDRRATPLVCGLGATDLAISFGGDGTFLRLVPLAYATSVPVLGVNFGNLGYLLEVEPSDLLDVLAQVLAGPVFEERAVLAITVEGGLTPASGYDRSLPGDGVVCPVGERWWVALNEMVVEKTVPGHMVRLSTAVDGDPLLTYRADGVLVATPTGSTAYNLSAGGPILSPGLSAMVLTPVAPHLAVNRSLVLHGTQTVTVEVLPSRPAVLVVDGQEAGRLSPGARVACRIAPKPVRVVTTGARLAVGSLRAAFTYGQAR